MCERLECTDFNNCLGGLEYCNDRFLEEEAIDFDAEHCQVRMCVCRGLCYSVCARRERRGLCYSVCAWRGLCYSVQVQVCVRERILLQCVCGGVCATVCVRGGRGGVCATVCVCVEGEEGSVLQCVCVCGGDGSVPQYVLVWGGGGGEEVKNTANRYNR